MKYRGILFLAIFYLLTGRIGHANEISFAPDNYNLNLAVKELKFEMANGGDNNVVVSPLSFYGLSTMLANGLNGSSLQEFSSMLPIDSLPNINASYYNYIKNKKDSIKINNSIWGNNFSSKYQSIIKNELGGEVLDPMGSTAPINTWVEKKTNGLMKNVLPNTQLSESELVLVNTIYFNSKWLQPFDKKDTEEDVFLGEKHNITRAMMMQNKLKNAYYYDDEEMQVIRLQYVTDDYITIYLPKPNINFTQFVNNLTPSKLNPKFSKKPVSLYLPKFEIEYNVSSPTQFYASMGISKMFMTSYDLSNMLNSYKDKVISEILLRAKIIVDETKTEAAAVSSLYLADGIGASSYEEPKYIEFRADRPFVFMINQGDFIGAFVTGE